MVWATVEEGPPRGERSGESARDESSFEGRIERAALLGAVVPVIVCALSAGATSAAPLTRTIAEGSEGAGSVLDPQGVPVKQSSGELYVAERGNPRGTPARRARVGAARAIVPGGGR